MRVLATYPTIAAAIPPAWLISLFLKYQHMVMFLSDESECLSAMLLLFPFPPLTSILISSGYSGVNENMASAQCSRSEGGCSGEDRG